MIRAKDVTKVFGSDDAEVRALRGVSLEVPRGQMMAIMGPSGSGKSTLLHILGGIEPPSSGEIWLDAHNLAGCNDRELTLLRRRRVGFVFQAFNLIPTLRVVDNVALPLMLDAVSPRQARTRAIETLEHVGLAHRLDHLPPQLSGGEQQRAAIARALVIRPALVLADEPTGNLDTRRGKEIMQLLSRLTHEERHTVAIVTHDTRVALKADRLVVLLDGLICYDGPPTREALAVIEEDRHS